MCVFADSVVVVEVQHVAVEVSENVFLVELLLAVQRELLAAHGTLPPVRLHVALETALLKVGRENDFAQGTAFMNVSPSVKAKARAALIGFRTLMIADCRSFTITSVGPLLSRVLQAVGRTETAQRLTAHHWTHPWRRGYRRGAATLLRGQRPVRTVARVWFTVRVSILQLGRLLGHQRERGRVVRVGQRITQHHRLPALRPLSTRSFLSACT